MKKALILLFSFCTAIVVAYAEAKPDLVYADTSNTDSSQLYSALYYTQLARSTKRINDNAVLFSYNKVYRQHIFGNDLFNFTDVLQHNPNFVSIYYSPDFPLNRALFRGHLIPTDGGLLDRLYSSKLPQYYYDLLEVQELEILPDGTINPVLYGSNLVSPEVYFAWQGGLFSGNMLKFRLARMLNRHLSLLAFISYSDLKRMHFYHGGGISNMYRSWYDDHSLISLHGYNPYSLTNKSGFRLHYDNNVRWSMRYSYSDIRQDLAYHSDSLLLTDTLFNLAYNENRNYLHQMDAMLELPVGDKFLWRNIGKLESFLQQEIPISRTLGGVFATQGSSHNSTMQSAGMQFLFAPVPNDTISLQYAVNRFYVETADIRHTTTHHTKVLAENKFQSPDFDRVTITTNGGVEFLRTNGRDTKKYPMYSANGEVKFGDFTTQIYSKLSLIPNTTEYILPKNEKSSPLHSSENYFLHGITIHYQFPVASIHGGYSLMVGGTRYRDFWHNGQSPSNFDETQRIYSAGFSLGQVGLLSTYNNIYISNESPALKSYSGLRLHFNRQNETRHFYTDFSYVYLSEREFGDGLRNYGGYPHWGRPIHDVCVKLAAEIETFRVFWKIDNILNRNNSYVPGYVMPGLVFRWGFSWNIVG